MSPNAKPTFRLSALLLLVGAAPIRVYLVVVVPHSTGWGGSNFRLVAAPFALAGMTIVIQRLLRAMRHAWPLAALLAGVIGLGALSIAAWLST